MCRYSIEIIFYYETEKWVEKFAAVTETASRVEVATSTLLLVKIEILVVGIDIMLYNLNVV